ncbi:MAG: DUF4838 domain-containing protein, partial [Clostridia bacterium]|nr:DUF4838 domain-containing protein [Clostridia bacterium]
MVTINTVTIARIGSHKTVKLAASELAKYLRKMETNAVVDERIYDEYNANLTDVLWVGMSEEFDKKLPTVKDKKFDDAILVDVENYCGVISGANERAVLIAVYRFLREIGVVWVRPGEGEEIVPKKALDICSVKVCEAPSYRHRSICIEGAISYQHIYNLIDWIPKAGMNGYFVQFEVPYTFFRRWYTHEHGDVTRKEITKDDVKHIMKKVTEDISDRGLLHYAVGHGWTCDPFGVVTGGWDKWQGEIPESIRDHLALVNGKREFLGGVPMNTQICMSDPVAVDIMCNAAANYCEKNPTVTHLEFWLADGTNCHCECEKCKDQRPADLYVNLLNRLDEILTQRNIDTKIVFIVYTDILWAPLKNKLKNEDRFVLSFAPITRNYSDSYNDLDLESLEVPPEFARNKLTLPESVSQSIALLREWQKWNPGVDSHFFEYHVWTRPNYDLGRIGLAELINRDIHALEKLGIGGYMSCQVQRSSFPNNILMESVAQTLWNKDVSFEDMKQEYMKNCYGEKYKQAMQYLETVSKLACPGPYIGSAAL